jgi:hypothetical protein
MRNKSLKSILFVFVRLRVMESPTVGVPYILLQVVSPFAPDSITVLQIERSSGDFVYVAWPTCPFHPNDVARIDGGTMRCTITYRGQTTTHNALSHCLEFRCLSRSFTLNKTTTFFTA